MARDMTKGSIVRTLVAFSVPLILSGLLQQLYGWADALIVGNFLGENALASIGATGTVSTMFTALLFGFSVGVSILTSHAWGEGEHGLVTQALSSFSILLGAAALALTGIGLALSRPLLTLLDTPPEILEGSLSYLRILYLGVPCMAVYNIYSAVLRGIGDSRLPFWAIAISSVCNVALDFLLVAVIPLGIRGAAIATVLSQAAMVVFMIRYAAKKYPILRFSIRARAVHGDVLRRGLRLSIPTALQSGMNAIGGLMLQGVMNSFGAQTVAAVTSAYRIDSVALLPVINIGSGISTFTGQNLGGGDVQRAKKGLKTGALMTVGTSLAIVAVILPLAGTLMRIFGISEDAVSFGQELLFSLAAFYPVFGFMNAMMGYLQGMDDVKFTGTASVLALGVRVGLSYALAPVFGRIIIAYAEIASWCLLALACFLRARWIGRRSARAAR